MYTRLALATGATVKAPVPISYTDRQAHRGPGPWPRAYTDLAYYGVWGPTTILKGRARVLRGRGWREGEDEGKRTRETPNIDLFEISNSPLSCRGARTRANARRVSG